MDELDDFDQDWLDQTGSMNTFASAGEMSSGGVSISDEYLDNVLDVFSTGGYQAVQGKPDLLEKLSGAASSANKWISENKKLSEVIAGAVGNAYTANESRKKSAEQLKAEQDKRDRINASIRGMKSPPKAGLIPSLTRNDGSAVYDSKGRFAK